MSHNKKFDFLVFICRAQPFHMGHFSVINQALNQSHKVIVLVGSDGCGPTLRNPWTFEERKKMILGSFPGTEGELFILPIRDYTYNDQMWVKQVQETVIKAIVDNIPGNTPNVTLHGWHDKKIGLIGHNKDNTSFYLKLFPTWESVEVENYDNINATDIRNALFSTGKFSSVKDKLPTGSLNVVVWLKEKTFQNLREEYKVVTDYKEQWRDSPYPPIFVTTDAVVVQSGHILLVERKAHPGKGRLALPGGYVNQSELLIDSMIRELREETRIKVPDPVLRGSIKATQVFDHPNRDPRGRIITHAFLIVLKPDTELPKVKGGDDAAKAGWYRLGEVKESQLYADHFHILETMIGRI